MKKYSKFVAGIVLTVLAICATYVSGSAPLRGAASSLISSGDEYYDSVTAQNMDGSKTRNFSIYGKQMSNGYIQFYAKDGNGTYDIQYIDTNKYKPFYVMAYGERWYFASRELDRMSGRTRQW